MWLVLIAGMISLVATAALAQPANRSFAPPALPSRPLTGLFNDNGWLAPRITADAFMQQQQEKRLGIMHSTPGAAQKPPEGFHFDITGKLIGALQYHWTAGQRPELGLRGLPIRMKIKTNGVYFGFSYRP